MSEYGARIRQIRESQGLRMRDVADSANDLSLRITVSAMSKLETGARSIQLHEAVILSEVLGVNLAEIAYGDRRLSPLSRLQASSLSSKLTASIKEINAVQNRIDALSE